MANIKLNTDLCVYCYKPAAFTECNDLDKNETVQKISKLFLNLLSRHLNINIRKLQCDNCCNDCLGILKKFCELYHQIKCLELKLIWQVDKLLNVMRWADRVPSRLKCFRTTNNFENMMKFRKKLKRKCKRHSSHSYPRVSISVLQSSVIPKIESLVLPEECNEESTIDELEIISISTEHNGGNFCVNDRNKTEHFLLGWVTTLSVLIFLCHLQVSKSGPVQDSQSDIELLDVNDDNDNTSEIPPVSPASQANSPIASFSDHDDNCDDDYHSPSLENVDFEQDSGTHNMELHSIKEEQRDIGPFPTTANSYFKTPLCPVLNAPELMSLLLQTENSTQLKTVNTFCQSTESQKSVFPLLSEPNISLQVQPETLSGSGPSENSTLRQLLADSKLTATTMPSTSSPLQDNTETSTIPVGRRSLRTKYQCSKCKATFSDISRFQGHQQKCFSSNNTESDSHSENDDNNDTVESMKEHELNYDDKVSSSSEDYSDDELQQKIKVTDFKSMGHRHRSRSKYTRKKNEKERNVHVKKTTLGNTHFCTKCIPNVPFHTPYALKKHEYHKHSNGRITIDKDEISKPDVKSIQMDGLSIATKYTCSSSNCAETFLLPQELENHEKLHGNFSCSICDLTLNHAIKLIDHELKHSNNTLKLANPDFKIGEIFACARCDYKNRIKPELVSHYMTEHLGLPAIQAKCQICQQEFLHVERVSLAHYINYHDLNRLDNPNDKVSCTEPDCSAYFLTEDQLHLHWNRQHVSGCTSQESNLLMQRKIAKRKKQLNLERMLHKNYECAHCSKTFFNRGELRSHIIRAHVKKMGYKHVEGTLGNYVISKEGVTINDIVFEENAKYICTIGECSEKFREEEDFERHSKLHGEFSCNFCPVVKSFADDLAIHETIHVTENDKNVNDERSVLRLRVFKCSRCSFKVGFRRRYLDHFVSMHLNLERDRKKCPICMYAFETDIYKKPHMISALKTTVHQHFMNWHDFTDVEGGEDKGAKKCDKCSAYFKTKLQLLFHDDNVHKPNKSKYENVWSNVCVDCDKDFADVKSLTLHRKLKHKLDLKFSCEIPGCLKKFETIRGLMHHDIINHSNNEIFICSDCGKSFFCNSAFTSHKQTHEVKVKTVKKNHVCEQCGKSFKDRPKLRQHYKFHESPDSWEFECEICKKKLSSKQKLNEHMRTHTKEKPFVCQVCGVAYAHRHNLRIHTNSKHKEIEDLGSKRVSTNFASWRKGKKLK